MRHLELARPLVFFDLETTGTDPARDRIVEIAALRLEADGRSESRTRRVHPGCPIPPEATAVHGIRDADVAGEPAFRQIAKSLLEFLEGADLAGFNILRFDLPLLQREFRDCGFDFRLDERKVVDVMTVFHRMEPRDLSAAARFYLGRSHEQAHSASGDVELTAEVLEAQLERYPELPRRVDALDAWCNPRPPGAVDRAGKFLRQQGVVVFGFGKHQGRPLAEVARERPDYLQWVLQSDFPEDAKRIVARALAREAPPPEPA